MNHKMLRRALVVVVAVGMLTGCGERGPENAPNQVRAAESSQGTGDGAELLNTERLNPEAMEALQVAAFDLSRDPELPIASRTDDGYDLVILGRIVEIREGPAMADMESGYDSGIVVVEIAATQVFSGDITPSETAYVLLDGIGLKTARAVLPSGTETMVSAYRMSDRGDAYFDDPRRGFAQGATRYEAGPLEFAVADGPEHTWLPQLKTSFDRPLSDGIPPELAEKARQR